MASFPEARNQQRVLRTARAQGLRGSPPVLRTTLPAAGAPAQCGARVRARHAGLAEQMALEESRL